MKVSYEHNHEGQAIKHEPDAIIYTTFEWLYPDLVDDAEIGGEPVGQGLGRLSVVLAPAGPVGGALVDAFLRLEGVLDGLVGEVVGAGGAEAVQDAVDGGVGGEDGAAEVGVDPELRLGGVAAGPGGGGGGGRRHLDGGREGGRLRAQPLAELLAEVVLRHCVRTYRENEMG